MPFIVYSLQDQVSKSVAEQLMEQLKPKEAGQIGGMRHFTHNEIDLLELPGRHLDADFLDQRISTDLIIFLSRHSSAKGVPAFTVHPEGNWTDEAKLGGRPKELATAAPVGMLRILQAIKRNNTAGIQEVYEATHHGPLLKTPSLYAEIGGNEDAWADKGLAAALAKSVVESIDAEASYDKVAVGIGGLHYADKFTRLALSGKYAFGHILPRHFVGEVDMLEQAIQRSAPRADVAVIEWKSLKAEEREKVIYRLNELGMDYVRE